MPKEQNNTQENASKSPAERLRAFSRLSKQFDEGKESGESFSDTQKTELASSVIDIQHLMAEKVQAGQLKEGQDEVFATLIHKSLLQLARENIPLPTPENFSVIQAKRFSEFSTHLQTAKLIIDSVKKEQRSISEDEKSSVVTIVVSFQHALCKIYQRKKQFTPEQQNTVDAAVDLLAILMPGMAEAGIVLPNIKTTQEAEKTEEIQQPITTIPQTNEQIQPTTAEEFKQATSQALQELKAFALEQYEAAKAELSVIAGEISAYLKEKMGIQEESISFQTVVAKGIERWEKHQEAKRQKKLETERQKQQAELEKQRELRFNWNSLMPKHFSIDNSASAEKGYKKVNQDVAGANQLVDRRGQVIGQRLLVIDGSGGSASFEQSAEVTRKMRIFMQRVFQFNGPLRSAALTAANAITRETLKGYGTFVGADIFQDQINICWRGDCAAVLWAPDGFKHRRSNYSNPDNPAFSNEQKRGKKSHFQLQNFIQNMANVNYATEKKSLLDKLKDKINIRKKKNQVTQTQILDVSRQANVVTGVIGNKELKSEKSISQHQVSKEYVRQTQTQFLLLCSDGAQPNTMIAEKRTPRNVIKKATNIMEQAYSNRMRINTATNEIYRLRNADTGNLYSAEVNRIMELLQANQISTAEASRRICLASKIINRDSDDITVQVVDLRQWMQN